MAHQGTIVPRSVGAEWCHAPHGDGAATWGAWSCGSGRWSARAGAGRRPRRAAGRASPACTCRPRWSARRWSRRSLPAVAQETLKRGSEGDGVAAVQRALGISADGVFGPMTRQAVKDFQARNGLEVDGIVGPMTSRALGIGGGAPSPSTPRPRPRRPWRVQRALGIPADGVYGPVTRAAVRNFQARHGLEVDGIAGPVTLGALGISGAPAGLPGRPPSPRHAPSSAPRTRSAARATAAGTARGSPSGRWRRPA